MKTIYACFILVVSASGCLPGSAACEALPELCVAEQRTPQPDVCRRWVACSDALSRFYSGATEEEEVINDGVDVYRADGDCWLVERDISDNCVEVCESNLAAFEPDEESPDECREGV